MREFIFLSQQAKTLSKVTRGAGVRKRVFRIVEALVDLNRGRPVTLNEVMRECIDAGIDTDKAHKFLETLAGDGIVSMDGTRVSITEGGMA
ncbi:MAG: hypothetical protein RTU30_08435 [Candidatus Thorarchaeota archaeon]